MKKNIPSLFLILIVAVSTSTLNANTIYPLRAFTSNGNFFDSSALNCFVKVKLNVSTIEFELYNESQIESCIAQIYFDDSSLLTNEAICTEAGTSFSISAVPKKLPAANLLTPAIETDFSFYAKPPGPTNGINPGEWLMLRFDLADGVTTADVTEALNNGGLRIGVHIIGLPDGPSESAANAPEPATLLLLGLGAIRLLRRGSG